MTSPTTRFFEELARRGHVSWLEHEHGRLRFEVVDGECVREWTVVFNDGDVAVSQTEGDPDVDAVLRIDRALFDRVVCGEVNVMAADLRGELSTTGQFELLAQMTRLLPGPPGQTGPRIVGNAGRQSG
jgi:SCP-2 sterol transfer family